MKLHGLLFVALIPVTSFAQRGTVSNASVMEWVGGVLTGAGQCTDAREQEVRVIDHGTGAAGTMDERAEEVLFNKTADTARGAARCLENTLSSFEASTDTRGIVLSELAHSWPSLTVEMSAIQTMLAEKNSLIQRTYADRIEPHPRRQALQREASSLDLLLTLAAGKLPFGEDPQMLRFYKRHAGKTLDQLRPLLERELARLKDNAEDSARRFDEKLVSATVPRTYRLGNDDKRDLSLAYYPEMVSAYGADAFMRDGLLCRVDKRYISGPQRISMITDVALAGVSIATLGAVSVVGGAAAIGRAALVLRGAQLAGALVGVAGSARALNLTHQACREAARTPNIALSGQCSVASALRAQRLRSGQSSCAYEAALAAVNVVGAAGNIRQVIRNARGAPSGIAPRALSPQVAVVAEMRRIPAIAAKLNATRATIVNSGAIRVARIDAVILANVADPDLKRGFRAALNQLQDNERIATYFEQLQADTFRRMLFSGNPIKVGQARMGQINTDDLIQVLRGRAAAQDVDVVLIKQPLSRSGFNAEIGKGFIVDEGFSLISSHGTWTHFVQQDMVYGLIARVANKRPQDVVRFFGTAKGMDVWDAMFDGFTQNALSPEWFKDNMMKLVIPLGSARRDPNVARTA
jgi:hypothetical protein